MGYTCCWNELDRRELLINIYSNFIGVRELTGNNDGFEVEMFIQSTGLDPKGQYAWCAAFTTYCNKAARVNIPKKSPAWSPSWFPQSNIIDNDSALRGDVFGIYFSSKKRVAHVGYIDESWDNDSNTILTVEGNTNEAGSREGDGVYRKRRSKKQIYKVSRWL